MALLPILSSALLIYSAATFQVCLTPPRPPDSQARKERRYEYESTFQILQLIMPIMRAIPLLFAIIESTTCLASTKEFSGLPVFRSINGLRYNSFNDGSIYPAKRLSNLLAASLLMAVIGGRFRMAARRQLGQLFVWEVTVQNNHRLITTGPYAVVRHPSYLGGVALVAGMSLALFAPNTLLTEYLIPKYPALIWIRGAFALYFNAAFVILCIRADGEDSLLKSHFGKEWEEWAKKVPYKVFPGVY